MSFQGRGGCAMWVLAISLVFGSTLAPPATAAAIEFCKTKKCPGQGNRKCTQCASQPDCCSKIAPPTPPNAADAGSVLASLVAPIEDATEGCEASNFDAQLRAAIAAD